MYSPSPIPDRLRALPADDALNGLNRLRTMSFAMGEATLRTAISCHSPVLMACRLDGVPGLAMVPRIADQVDDHLGNSVGIDLCAQDGRQGTDDLGAGMRGACLVDEVVQQGDQVHIRALQVQAQPALQARHVHHLADEPLHAAAGRLDALADLSGPPAIGTATLEHARGHADGVQRVAQVMAQHGHGSLRVRFISAVRAFCTRTISSISCPAAFSSRALQCSAVERTVSFHRSNEPRGVSLGPRGPGRMSLSGLPPQWMVSICSLRRKISQPLRSRSKGMPSKPHQGDATAARPGASSGSDWV